MGGIAPVPDPNTMLLLGSGLAGIGYFRRRWKLAYAARALEVYEAAVQIGPPIFFVQQPLGRS